MADKSFAAALKEAQDAARPFFDERRAIRDKECPARIEKLRRLHVNIDSIGGNCPVQAEGTIKGQPFYFRARGDEWSLEIGPRELWHSDDIWRVERPYREWPAAGWMHEHEALDFIAEGARLWMKDRRKEAGKCKAA